VLGVCYDYSMFPYRSRSYKSLKINYTNDLYGHALKRGNCVFLTGSCPNPTPKEVYEELLESFVNENEFCSYTVGSLGLKKEIANYIEEHSQVAVDVSSNILVTLGATTFLQQLFLYLLDEDSDCLVITPTFQDYYNQLRFTRASITEVAMEEKSPDWPLDTKKVQQALRGNTKVILLCSPNNPTGKIYTRQELMELGEIAKENDILLVVDEAYNYLTYDKPFTSALGIPRMRDRVVVARTFSKEFSMCGWRVGYAYVPASIHEELFHLQLSFNTVASAVSQKAAEISLQSPAVKKQVQEDLEVAREKRDFVIKGIDEIGHGLTYITPQACPYLFVKYLKDIKSYYLCKDIIDKVGVVVSPGVGNGAAGEHHFCITFADCMGVISEGMSRLGVYFSKYY